MKKPEDRPLADNGWKQRAVFSAPGIDKFFLLALADFKILKPNNYKLFHTTQDLIGTDLNWDLRFAVS